MLPRNHPDRIKIAFDDHRLVANAGLLLPATLAHHLGLSQLVQERLNLGNAPGRANTGDKVMTLVATALAGGDCIDDADALRTGGTACTLATELAVAGEVRAAPSPGSEPFHSQPDGSRLPPTRPAHNRGPRKLAPPRSASGSFRVLCPHLAPPRRPPAYPNASPDNRACNSLTPFRCPHAVHLYESVDSG